MMFGNIRGLQERLNVVHELGFVYCTFSLAPWHLLLILEENQSLETVNLVLLNNLRICIMIYLANLNLPSYS
jgi:hypothetical protein